MDGALPLRKAGFDGERAGGVPDIPARRGPTGNTAASQRHGPRLVCRPTCAVLPVEGARHNSLKVAKKSQLAVEGRFVAAVKRFLAAE